MENRRKHLTRDHKRVLPEVAENKIVPEKDMGRAKSDAAGTSRETKDVRKKKSTKERWLLTRKTWRYMADAGRKLIPDGAHNRVEDIPKIESYFQHVCRKEPRFLLWRKSSYPGALGFRSHTRRNRNRKKGGSYREKASSADEAEDLAWTASMKEAATSREVAGAMVMTPTTSGRFDVQRLRQEFLDSPSTSVISTSSQKQEKPERPKSFLQKFSLIHSTKTTPTKSPVIEEDSFHETDLPATHGTLYLERSQSSLRQEPESPESVDELEELNRKEFIDTLTRYLSQEDEDDDEGVLKPSRKQVSDEQRRDIDFQLLLDQLRKNLAAEFSSQRLHERSSTERHHQGGTISTRSNITPSVHFEGDNQQKMLLETLHRYFGKTTNREKMISDLLTDRKLLDKLYSDLRRTRGSRGRSAGAGGSGFAAYLRLTSAGLDRRREGGGERDIDELDEPSSWKRLSKPSRSYREGNFSPPPLIEVQHEIEPVYVSRGTQTEPVPATMLAAIEEELRKAREKAREENEGIMSPGGTSRRRSSVDHDDVSPSVSDTIKRYLRMARKKSLDSDKVDRFKRVNYDRNLRNIKPKGEITKPGDDDGLNKGSQSDESWIDAMKELKLDDIVETSDVDGSGGNEEMFGSLVTSSRSSVDIDDGLLSPASPPHSKGILSSGQSFLSHLLHGLQHSQTVVQTSGGLSGAGAALEKDGATSKHSAAGMQKSKSSSSVVQHGRNLVSKKIWRSRSKSQIRPSAWTPQGQCVWANVDGRQVTLTDTTLMELSPLETKELQKVAVAKLHALNLGVSVKIPDNSGEKSATTKPKRRPYLLKRKALTTGFFDTARSKDKAAELDKEKSNGFMFGIPLNQILDNERTRSSRNESPMRSRISSSVEDELGAGLRRQSQHGSHSSFTSFIDSSKADEESGSCESLMSPSGSVPGLLDSLSASAYDVSSSGKESTVPQIVPMCIKHLEAHGLRCSGLFRKFGLKTKVRELKEELDSGRDFELDPETDPLSVASLLKTFLRDLPDPLLCKGLYNAFIRTQKIRNRRLQHEAVQHLVQLLPTPNRDILHMLLNFLVLVSHNAAPFYLPSGDKVPGNDMDSYSLSVVMAPNLLSNMTINPMDLSDEVKTEINDGINVFRSMIDHAQELFVVSADLLNDVYLHLMDSHPEALDILLSKRDAGADDCNDEHVSPVTCQDGGTLDTSSRSPSFLGLDVEVGGRNAGGGGVEVDVETQQVRRVWSREDFLHETAGMGGPDVSMRPRHVERGRGREKSSKKRHPEEQSMHGHGGASDGSHSPTTRSTSDSITTVIQSSQRQTSSRIQEGDSSQKIRSVSVDSGNVTSTEELSGKLYKVFDDHERRQSSPVVSDKSGIITASLKIPVPNTQPFSLNRNDADIPYIEDGTPEAGKQSVTIGVVRSTAITTRAARQRSISGSDSSQASTVLPAASSAPHGSDSAMGSSATFSSPLRNTTPSVCSSSGGEAGLFSSTPSWASTPPTSPDSTVKTVNYIPEDEMQSARFSIPAKGTRAAAVADDAQTARFTIPTKGLVGYQRGTSVTAIVAKEIAPVLLQKVTFTSTSELQQVQKNTTNQKTYSPGSSGELTKSATTSAIHVGNKRVEVDQEQRESDRKLTTSISSIGGAVMRSKTADIERILKLQKDTGKLTQEEDKKSNSKRRYTDSRHQTRHIPDAEALVSTSTKTPTNVGVDSKAIRSRSGPVWKRREIIASDPKEPETFL